MKSSATAKRPASRPHKHYRGKYSRNYTLYIECDLHDRMKNRAAALHKSISHYIRDLARLDIEGKRAA